MKIMKFSAMEKKWQKRWEKGKAFVVKEGGKKPKYYNLEMYAYPSGQGIHMGHALNYTIGDIRARLKRMQGFNVLYPTGFDSFGLPAENAAIKAKAHPKKFTEDAIKSFIKQIKSLGISYDWTRMIQSHDPEYYKWDQWIFLKMFDKGLAYRKEAPVNFCKLCKTVLANEQVINGKCWRHENENVQTKQLEQWFLKTTAYADELLKGLDKLDGWPELIKKLQRNWIGRSEGTEVDFDLHGYEGVVGTFTTRPDTTFGTTYLVLAPEHPLVERIMIESQKKEVEKYIAKALGETEIERTSLKKEKTGVFTGAFAVHPLTGNKIPIWIADYVLMHYGTGAIMAVPAHDDRDYFFAKKYKLPIVNVIDNPDKSLNYLSVNLHDEDNSKIANFIREESRRSEAVAPTIRLYNVSMKKTEGVIKLLKKIGLGNDQDYNLIRKGKSFTIDKTDKMVKLYFAEVYTGYGVLMNSEGFDGLKSQEAIEHITTALEIKKKGRKATVFRLKDWLISRQRFWGTPIPIIYCDACGAVPVKEKDLPVRLPENIKFTGTENPLKNYRPFVDVKCPKCGKTGAKRETDTMDTFANSSWYFLRFCDPGNGKKIFDSKKANYWMPIDQYIGGKEHAYLHLIYSRFYTKFLRDLGLFNKKIGEPAVRLFNQGYIYGKDGRKMSKSLGNVINPNDVTDKYGADALRLFLVSVASPDKDFNWDDKGVEGSLRFVMRVMDYARKFKASKMTKLQESRLNRTIRDYTNDLEGFRYNLAVIKLRELFGVLEEGCDKKSLGIFLKLFSVVCPHIAEELWGKLGNKKFISLQSWPEFDKKKINDKLEEGYDNMIKTAQDGKKIIEMLNVKNPTMYIYTIPSETSIYLAHEEMMKQVSGAITVEVYPNNKKNIHDPQGKAKKAKPGRPGIYID